jgi:hypothetical protein
MTGLAELWLFIPRSAIEIIGAGEIVDYQHNNDVAS